MTRGIVGAVRAGWLQTDATMLPGNSGGIVAINSIRALIDAATTPGAARVAEFAVTGQEFIAPVVVGRRCTYRSTYSGQSEYTSEITQVTNLAGALVYVRQNTLGTETRSILAAEGLFTLGQAGRTWRSTFPEPRKAFLFPPCPGVAWRSEWRTEDSSDRSVRQTAATEKIESVGETITVAAGAFSQVLRIVAIYEVAETKGGRTQSFRTHMTEWWAPGAGLVRSVEESIGGSGRWVTELVSQFLPSPPR